MRGCGIVLLLVFCGLRSAFAIDLAERTPEGGAAYAIVVRAEASVAERCAASELRTYLVRMTGVDLPIVTDADDLPAKAVLLGMTRHTPALAAGTDRAQLGDEGFRFKSVPPHLLVEGSAVRGTLYGVYDLLERFGGCRWYAADCEIVPKRTGFAVPDDLDRTETPAFAFRQTSWKSIASDVPTAVRNKMSLSAGDGKWGGGSVRYSAKLGRCHTFATILPPSRHFADHPEYFSFHSGARQKTHTQLCLTNPDVLRLATDFVLADIAENHPKGVRYYGISQNDWSGFCECPACAAVDAEEESHAGSIIRFVNAIADVVAAKYPDVTLETLAYTYSQTPPRKTRPRRNVLVCHCSIRCDFAHSFEESAFPENVRFAKELAAWHKIAGRLFVWDYTTDFAHYCNVFPNTRVLRKNLAFLQANGVEQIYEQGNSWGVHGDWAELKAWLLTKLMWNPQQDEEALLDDFFAGYYGPAAAPLRKCFDAVHAFPRDAVKHPMGCYEVPRDSPIPDALLDGLDPLFGEAERLAAGTAYLDRVKQARLSTDYMRVMRYIETTAGFNVSRDCGSINSEHWIALQGVARRFLTNCTLDGKTVVLSEDPERHARHRRLVDAFLAQRPPHTGADVLPIEERFLAVPSGSGRGEYVEDVQADDGRALFYPNSHSSWAGRFKLDVVRFDQDVAYKVRFRVRIVPHKGAMPNGEVFWAGVYRAGKNSSATPDVSVKVRDVKDAGYDWYETAAFVPDATDFVWSAPGRHAAGAMPTHDGVYIDRFEIVRAE